uniref:Amino acid permease/ SLC12A domain-containing protein n=1 Tax=Bionectria ochroleuca TaxID=29856 RepID=A0A8H7K7P5_BIOOC
MAPDQPEAFKKEADINCSESIRNGEIDLRGASINDGTVDQVTALELAINHRRLNARQIQLTSIAGSIGAALFVAIGSGLTGGPLALLLAFLFWATVVFSVAKCRKRSPYLMKHLGIWFLTKSGTEYEIVTQYPLDGSFIRLAGHMVDPALGVAFAQTSYAIFECTIINSLVQVWGYDQSPAILITISIVLYMAINIYRADLFGEVEFWLALGKILLATGLLLFTFVAMLGGNPLNDRFGFRHWKDPGPWKGETAGEQLMSFVNGVNVAGFVMAGPEYISMIAGEAKDPRRTIPRAFNTIMYRLVFFFIGGALAVGILVPYNDQTLTGGADTYAGASPYVIAAVRLKIPVLPSIITAALITSIISAGNAYTFNASRSLHALALEGQAPKFLRKLNKHGVPYMAVIVVMVLACLSYLALSSGTAKVLNWILNFCTAATMLNWAVMSFTYIRFHHAMRAQNIDKKSFLPVVSRLQPYAGYWAFFWSFFFLWVQGYAVFLDGKWEVATFVFNYGIIGLATVIAIFWKIFKRTKWHKSKDVDLHSGLEFFEALDEHYRQERENDPPSKFGRALEKVF